MSINEEIFDEPYQQNEGPDEFLPTVTTLKKVMNKFRTPSKNSNNLNRVTERNYQREEIKHQEQNKTPP